MRVSSIVYLNLYVLLFAGCTANKLALEDPDIAKYNQYLSDYADMKGYKAIAIARDSSVDWVVGWSYGFSTQVQSNDSAVLRCNRLKTEKKIADNCRILKVGDTFFTELSEAAQGNQIHRLCCSYIYGQNGFTKDYDKALKHCTEASEYGYSSSQTLLAEIYENGYSTSKDLLLAADLYEMAAIQGHDHAQTKYYVIQNEDRIDTSSEEEKAAGLRFLNIAAEGGYEYAIRILNDLED